MSRIGKANLIKAGPITLGGIGSVKTESSHGIYKVELSTADGYPAIMSGVCSDKVTPKFPSYPLKWKVEEDIRRGFTLAGYDPCACACACARACACVYLYLYVYMYACMCICMRVCVCVCLCMCVCVP